MYTGHAGRRRARGTSASCTARKRAAAAFRLRCLHPLGTDEQVVIETESDNSSSLALYDRLGFKQDKRLHRFYSNGKDAYVPSPIASKQCYFIVKPHKRGR